MYKLGFSVIWTVLATMMAVAFFLSDDFAGQSAIVRVIFLLFPLVGLFFIRDSVRKLRRFHSVRKVGDAFVWTETDGATKRSIVDPRIAWDAEDRDFSED